MPNTIEIIGVIGWDVFPSEISVQLKKFKGEPVQILFSSDGGYVSDGLAIFNLIHSYKGETTAIIIGVAASMSSYIPLAANKVIAKSNAVMMIHDPIMGVYGTQAEHEKIAKILGGFANMLADIYAKKTGKSIDEIRSIMQEESFFFGSEMLAAGLVDEIDEIEINSKNKDDTIIDAMIKFEMASNRIKTKPEDFNKIAAYLPKSANIEQSNTTVFSTPGSPAFSNHSAEDRMDINQLKAEHPDVYNTVLDRGKTAGSEALKETHQAEGMSIGMVKERKRASEIKALALPGQETLMQELIEDGSSPADAAVKFLGAQKETLSKVSGNMKKDLQKPLASDSPENAKPPESEAKNPVVEFDAAVEKAMAGGLKKAKAMKAVAKSNPELHQAWIDAISKGGAK